MLLEVQDISQLQKWYKEFNTFLFNNELPEIPLKFNRAKRSAAAVNSTIQSIKRNGKKEYDNDSIIIKNISFSTLHIKTDEALKGIMVHEMIHVWLLSNGVPFTTGDKSHGKEFMDKLHELQSKVNFTIPITEDVTQLEVNAKGKTFYIAYIKRKSGNNSISSYSKTFFYNNFEDLKRNWNLQTRGGLEILLGTSKVPDLEIFPAKRTTKLSSYKLEKNIEDKIKADMNVMVTLKE